MLKTVKLDFSRFYQTLLIIFINFKLLKTKRTEIFK